MHTSFLLVIRHLRSYIARSVFVRMYIRSTIECHLNGQAAIRRTSHSFDASVIVPTFIVNFHKARSLSVSISMSLSISRQRSISYFTLLYQYRTVECGIYCAYVPTAHQPHQPRASFQERQRVKVQCLWTADGRGNGGRKRKRRGERWELLWDVRRREGDETRRVRWR